MTPGAAAVALLQFRRAQSVAALPRFSCAVVLRGLAERAAPRPPRRLCSGGDGGARGPPRLSDEGATPVKRLGNGYGPSGESSAADWLEHTTPQVRRLQQPRRAWRGAAHAPPPACVRGRDTAALQQRF